MPTSRRPSKQGQEQCPQCHEWIRKGAFRTHASHRKDHSIYFLDSSVLQRAASIPTTASQEQPVQDRGSGFDYENNISSYDNDQRSQGISDAEDELLAEEEGEDTDKELEDMFEGLYNQDIVVENFPSADTGMNF
jgi:hypothetical protein